MTASAAGKTAASFAVLGATPNVTLDLDFHDMRVRTDLASKKLFGAFFSHTRRLSAPTNSSYTLAPAESPVTWYRTAGARLPATPRLGNGFINRTVYKTAQKKHILTQHIIKAKI